VCRATIEGILPRRSPNVKAHIAASRIHLDAEKQTHVAANCTLPSAHTAEAASVQARPVADTWWRPMHMSISKQRDNAEFQVRFQYYGKDGWPQEERRELFETLPEAVAFCRQNIDPDGSVAQCFGAPRWLKPKGKNSEWIADPVRVIKQAIIAGRMKMELGTLKTKQGTN
jgi:hypothetical protein